VKVSEILRLIGRDGWYLDRQRGSHRHYAIVIEGDGSTNYSAYAPDLPGVVATGDTLEECEAEMREAIEFHIEGLRIAGEPVPPATSHVAVVTVAA
jgi:predicted RNase H-like HicB family nuclease